MKRFATTFIIAVTFPSHFLIMVSLIKVLKYLNDAIDRRDEGIIVKHPGAPYAPNKRKGSGWFKIKPEYVSGVVDDLDLCIVGGKFGSGRHGSLINKFMLGVRDGDQKNSKFKSFCMVGSGYTDTELLQITETLKPHLQVFDKKKQPEWLSVGKEKPEVVIHPTKSVVVQVNLGNQRTNKINAKQYRMRSISVRSMYCFAGKSNRNIRLVSICYWMYSTFSQDSFYQR